MPVPHDCPPPPASPPSASCLLPWRCCCAGWPFALARSCGRWAWHPWHSPLATCAPSGCCRHTRRVRCANRGGPAGHAATCAGVCMQAQHALQAWACTLQARCQPPRPSPATLHLPVAAAADEQHWREVPELAAGSETPEYLGRAVAALAGDAAVLRHSGQVRAAPNSSRTPGALWCEGPPVLAATSPPYSSVLAALSPGILMHCPSGTVSFLSYRSCLWRSWQGSTVLLTWTAPSHRRSSCRGRSDDPASGASQRPGCICGGDSPLLHV